MLKGLGLLINGAAREFQISPTLIAGVILKESGGVQYATRFEKGFYHTHLENALVGDLIGYLPPENLCTLQTERILRATSFGVMQVLGETMRERTFRGLLPEFYDPALNIRWGTEFLAHLIKVNKNVREALLDWNGGGDPNYPAAVMKFVEDGEATKVLSW